MSIPETTPRDVVYDWTDGTPRARPAAAPQRARPASPATTGSTRVHVAPGVWEVEPDDGIAGYWVTAGLLARNVTVGRSASLDLLGPQDLLVPVADGDAGLASSASFTALTDVELLVLDEAFLMRLRTQPRVLFDLLKRAGVQQHRMATHRAIVQTPGVDGRLMAIFDVFAERWGRVGPEGVEVPLKLGHAALGGLIGARRPTVSLALKGLDEEQRLTRRADGTWLLPR